MWEWEWDGWKKRRKERVCCLFTFTFYHLLGSFSRVGGNQSSTTKQKVEKGKGKKKKNKILDFNKIKYYKEVLDFRIIEYHITF